MKRKANPAIRKRMTNFVLEIFIGIEIICLSARFSPSRVIRPVQNRLTLADSTTQVSISAILFYLRDMSNDSLPSLYLPHIIRTSAAHIITAIPLEPAPRVIFPYPPLLLPDGKWL